MKRAVPLLLSACLATGAPQARGAGLGCGPDAPLSLSVRLDYAATANRGLLSLAGDGVVIYRRNGDAYAMTSTLRAAGIFEADQGSVGAVGSDGLAPTKFTQQGGRRPPISVDFDWPGRQVAFSQTGTQAPIQPQMQDRLSLLFQLAWRQRSAPDAATIEIPVASQRSTATYVFADRQDAALVLPAGRFDTVRFARHRKGAGDLLEVWLAPALCGLPVRLRFTDDKGTVISSNCARCASLLPSDRAVWARSQVPRAVPAAACRGRSIDQRAPDPVSSTQMPAAHGKLRNSSWSAGNRSTGASAACFA